jgi:hypothetical protein
MGLVSGLYRVPDSTRKPAKLAFLIAAATVEAALLVSSLLSAPRATQAMPEFAQATGLACSACHTVVPLLNAYGRNVQNSGYSLLDRHALAKTLPVWIDDSLNYDSTAGSGTGTPRYDFGNIGLHGIGYAAPDVTYHLQQWFASGGQSGGLDTLWVAYNHVFDPNAHLFFGKLELPGPSPYSQTSDLDGPAASNTIVGEHDWGATIAGGNRWGTKFAYLQNGVDLEAAYVFSSDDLNGLTDFNPGDKTFMWKAAHTQPKSPLEVGLFGTFGSVPVSTGTDNYSSAAVYAELDPNRSYRPGFLAIYQGEHDWNPGIGPNGLPTPALGTRGFSAEVNELLFGGNLLLSARHDFNDAGIAGSTTNGDAFNASFNLPGLRYLHGYLEANVGGNSALAGDGGGPEWKGMLWLTLPISTGPR